MKKIKKEKPWLDENGKIYPLKKIEAISKDWDDKTWERYLAENIDVEMKEDLFGDANEVENFSQDQYKNNYLDLFDQEEYPILREAFDNILRDISGKEAIILKSIFYEKMNSSQVAEKFKLHPSTVIRARDRGITLIKRELEKTNRI